MAQQSPASYLDAISAEPHNAAQHSRDFFAAYQGRAEIQRHGPGILDNALNQAQLLRKSVPDTAFTIAKTARTLAESLGGQRLPLQKKAFYTMGLITATQPSDSGLAQKQARESLTLALGASPQEAMIFKGEIKKGVAAGVSAWVTAETDAQKWQEQEQAKARQSSGPGTHNNGDRYGTLRRETPKAATGYNQPAGTETKTEAPTNKLSGTGEAPFAAKKGWVKRIAGAMMVIVPAAVVIGGLTAGALAWKHMKDQDLRIEVLKEQKQDVLDYAMRSTVNNGRANVVADQSAQTMTLNNETGNALIAEMKRAQKANPAAFKAIAQKLQKQPYKERTAQSVLPELDKLGGPLGMQVRKYGEEYGREGLRGVAMKIIEVYREAPASKKTAAPGVS